MSDIVKTIIDQEAYAQVNKLTEDLKKAKTALLELLGAGKEKPNWSNLKLPGDLHQLITANAKAIAELNAQMAKQTATNEKLKSSLTKLRAAKQKQHEASLQERIDRQIVNRLDRQVARSTSQVATAYEQLSNKLAVTRRKFKDYALTLGENHRKTRKLRKEAQEMDKVLKRIDSQVGQHQRSVGNYGKAWGNVGGMMRQVIAAFGLYSAVDVARKIYAEVKAIDQLNKALKQVTIETDGFGQAQTFLVDLAHRTGIELNTLQKTYTKFYASAKETNLTLNETQDIFTQTAMSGAVLGLSTDNINGSMRALEQILSKGKVQAEEIRGQLGERLPGAFQILAKSMGITTAELNQMLERGEVISEVVLPGFARELAKSFSLDNTKKVETLAAAQGRLSNAWNLWLRELEGGENAISRILIGLMDSLATGVENAKDSLKKVTHELTLMRRIWNGFMWDLRQLRAETDETGEKFKGFKKIVHDVGQALWWVATASVGEVWATLFEVIRVGFQSIIDPIRVVLVEIKNFFTAIGSNNFDEAIDGLRDINVRMTDAFLSPWRDALDDFRMNRELIQKEYEEFIKWNGSLAPLPKGQDRKWGYWPMIDEEEKEKPKPKGPKGKDYTKEDAFNLAKERLLREMALEKEVSDNREASLADRLLANERYTRVALQLLDLETEYAISNAGERKDLIKKLEEEHFWDRKALSEEFNNEEKAIVQDNFDFNVENFEKLSKNDEIRLKEDLVKLQRHLIEKGLTAEEIEDEVTKHKENALKDQLKAQIEYAIKELEVIAETAENEMEIRGKIVELRQMLNDLDMPKPISKDEGMFSKEELEKIKAWMDIVGEAFSSLMDLADALTERRIQNIEREIEKNNEMYDKMMEAEGISDEAKREITAQREREQAILEKKKRKEEIRQAKFQKANSIMNVVMSTAGAIMKTYETFGFPTGIPFAIAQGAIGAIQLAAVAAQPLPQYEFGKDGRDGYAGPMIWGEKRKEVKVGADGTIEVSPNRPTFGTTQKGDTIFPSMAAFQNSTTYDDIVKATMLTSISNQHNRLDNYQIENVLDSHLKSARDEMRKGVEDAMRKWKFPMQKTQDFEGVLKRMQKRDV